MCLLRVSILISLLVDASGFWELETTTDADRLSWSTPRRSFFKWQYSGVNEWAQSARNPELALSVHERRQGAMVAGLSVGFLPLGVGTILSRRLILTSHNFLAPYDNSMRDVRIWALGLGGDNESPYRYRVWRWRRIFPRSLNPEHQHGPRHSHQPRHDLALVFSWDAMIIQDHFPTTLQHAYSASLTMKHYQLHEPLLLQGSGYIDITHINENYYIMPSRLHKAWIVNCEEYLPKQWGKFICVKNVNVLAGVPSGGPLFSGLSSLLTGVGSFEIRYNEDRILVFTDLRYYVNIIQSLGNVSPGDYYDYAFPESRNVWQRGKGWSSFLNSSYKQNWDEYVEDTDDLMWDDKLSQIYHLRIWAGFKPSKWPYKVNG